MKWVTFRRAGDPEAGRVGLLTPSQEGVIDVAAALQRGADPSPSWSRDMLAVLDAGPEAQAAAARLMASAEIVRQAIPLGEIRLLAPLPRPRSIRDCMSCEGHVIQFMRAVVKRRWPLLAWTDAALERLRGRGWLQPPPVWYEQPIYYKGNPASVVGPEADVRWPSYTTQLDYELEFAAVIGRRGRDIPAARAREFIAGYLIFNDFSARDAQLREMRARLGPAKGKDFDTGNALGPWLVTPDEVPDPYRLAMAARVNGEVWSQGRSGQMRHPFEAMIAHISRDETLYPGDVIGSGAIAGGCGIELDRWLKVGDVVELEVERLGILRNRIVAAEETAGRAG